MSTDLLAAVVSHQLQGASKAWSGLLGTGVTFAPPRVEPIPEGGLETAGLSWPLVVTKMEVAGDFEGSLYAFLSVPDAVTFGSLLLGKLPGESRETAVLDPERMDALRELFNLFCLWTAQALQREGVQKVHVTQGFTREFRGRAGLDWIDVPTGGWTALTKLSLGGWSMELREVIPAEVGKRLIQEGASADREKAFGGGTTVRRRKGRSGKVLAVDDVASIRNIIKWILEKEGFAVLAAAGGDEALEMMSREKPDAVLLDVMMPGMDGFEVCRRIRQLPEGKDVPVIMCTCNDKEKDVVQAIRAGANDYIVKPFAHATLLDKIRKVCGRTS